MSEIQFERAEYPAGSAMSGASCAGCRRPVSGTYYQVGDKIICEACSRQVLAARGRQLSVRDMLSGVALGTLGGLAGAAVWAIVMIATKYIVGIVAVLVGWLVAAGVKKGSGGRGGNLMRVLAVIITFASIVVAYFPSVLMDLREKPDMQGAGGVLLAIVGSIIAPFAGVIPVLLLGFALYQAWKGAAVKWLDVKGPFTLAGPQPSDVALTQPSALAAPGDPPGSAQGPPAIV